MSRRYLFRCLAGAGLAAVLAAACTSQPMSTSQPDNTSTQPSSSSQPLSKSPQPSSPGQPFLKSDCDPVLWQHVYHAYRLHVVSACKTVTGIIEAARKEPDGDYHILLKPDQAGLVNSVNVSEQHGDLVLEPVCENSVTQADALAACSGFTGDVRVPPDGTRVSVTGSYVLDADHGWMEIHPVSRITVIGSQPVPVSSSVQPSSTHAAPAGCYPKTPGGNCYEPGEFCSVAEHGETGVAGDGKMITCTDVSGRWRWES